MSSLLSESDLNDFISPGLACIKPTETVKEKKEAGEELEVGKESNEMEKVSISLQDCLACSGCITSSEEILLSRQSHTVFLEAWNKLPEDTTLVVSIPPQSRLSLAHYFEMSLDLFDECFINIMRTHFGAKYVVGTQIGRAITVYQTNQALIKRKEKEGTVGPALSAVCPGFVLYAEKSKPELVPYLLDVKSPQQITGALLKKTAANVYHLTVMPCFDKKLEASRKDGTGEVDCVITPREFVTMLQEQQLDLRKFGAEGFSAARLADVRQECSPPGWDTAFHWSSNAGSSSGGYAYQYILYQQTRHPGSHIATIEGKNSDIREYRLLEGTDGGKTLASASELYGFRNIQNVVRKLTGASSASRGVKVLRKRAPASRTGSSKLETAPRPTDTDFIEVMACPGGCINGGGLLNGEQNSSRRRALAKNLDSLYQTALPQLACDPPPKDLPIHEQFRYQFTAIEKPSDVVAVGNTW